MNSTPRLIAALADLEQASKCYQITRKLKTTGPWKKHNAGLRRAARYWLEKATTEVVEAYKAARVDL